MLCLNLKSTDPFFNLAVEEYLLKNSTDEYLIIYINAPSVIIGKHQVAHREADAQYVTKNNIPVIRRISGGGTVFHDEGNLNFSFISQSEKGRQIDFMKYISPVIEFLASLGVNAEFGGKNDIRVNTLKISGNAEHVYRERVLHHGTLLFSSQLKILKSALRKETIEYSTRAVGSTRSQVMNLKGIIPGILTIEEFGSKMLNFLKASSINNTEISLLQGEEKKIGSLAESKYRTWEWNYAYGPDYNYNARFEIHGISHDCRLFVKEGIIRECAISGTKEMASAAGKLTGCRHMPEDIKGIFRNENILISDSDIFKFF